MVPILSESDQFLKESAVICLFRKVKVDICIFSFSDYIQTVDDQRILKKCEQILPIMRAEI